MSRVHTAWWFFRQPAPARAFEHRRNQVRDGFTAERLAPGQHLHPTPNTRASLRLSTGFARRLLRALPSQET
jgi:hypothetical protein